MRSKKKKKSFISFDFPLEQTGRLEKRSAESARKFATADLMQKTKRVAGTRRKGHSKKKSGQTKSGGELTPVTRAGCNHVSVTSRFLDWTVRLRVRSRRRRWSSCPLCSRANKRVYTRADVVDRSPACVCVCMCTLLSASALALFVFLSSLALSRLMGSRRAQMSLSRQRARPVRAQDEFPFFFSPLILHWPVYVSSFCLSFSSRSTASRQLHSRCRWINRPLVFLSWFLFFFF